MMDFIYNVLVSLVSVFIRLPAIFNAKLQKGVKGRDRSFGILKSNIEKNDRVVWMHVASLGEFEQGRPVLDCLRKQYPTHKILLTFFSPSGYEIRKDYSSADLSCYLPLDTDENARTFLKIVHPELVVFVKYDLWPNYLKYVRLSRAKSILISAVAHQKGLFKYAPGFQVQLLNAFNVIAVQDQSSADVFSESGVQSQLVVTGDTRIDRTLEIANDVEQLPIIEKFCGEDKVLVAGSTWYADEEQLSQLLQDDIFKNWKLIIAPHDVAGIRINELKQIFSGALKYSELYGGSTFENERILIIDSIGLLNKIYRYGHVAYIGGGFGSGIHNILEPAAFGLPVIFGPNYRKFLEARTLVKEKGAFSVKSADELINVFYALDEDSKEITEKVNAFMQANQGATEKVMKQIKKLMS